MTLPQWTMVIYLNVFFEDSPDAFLLKLWLGPSWVLLSPRLIEDGVIDRLNWLVGVADRLAECELGVTDLWLAWEFGVTDLCPTLLEDRPNWAVGVMDRPCWEMGVIGRCCLEVGWTGFDLFLLKLLLGLCAWGRCKACCCCWPVFN